MPSGDINSFKDARVVLEKALESERGIIVEFTTHGSLVNFRQRCYTLRAKERDFTRQVFPVGDAARGASQFDALKIVDATKKGISGYTSPFVLKITKLSAEGLPEEILQIEEL